MATPFDPEFVEIIEFNGFTITPSIPERLQPQYYAGLSRATTELAQHEKDPEERMWKIERAADFLSLSRLIKQDLEA